MDAWSFKFEMGSSRSTRTLPVTFNSSPLPLLLFYPLIFFSFTAKFSFPSPVLLPPIPLSAVPLFSVHLSPSHSAFPPKTKKTKDQGIAQTAAETPAVTPCNKPLFSIPLCTLSHFPISPHSLRDTLYWFSTATNVKPINISCSGMKSIDNTPPRVAGIFFFSLLKEWSSPVVYYQKTSCLCSATYLLMFCWCLCSLMAGPWPTSMYEINTLSHVLKETIFKSRNCCLPATGRKHVSGVWLFDAVRAG